jgi:hypothetical protein
MTPKLSNEQREALKVHPEGPLKVEDDQTHQVYVLISQDRFQKMQQLFYDDSDLTGDEMMALAARGLDDPEGWGAPGMEEYDDDDSSSQSA